VPAAAWQRAADVRDAVRSFRRHSGKEGLLLRGLPVSSGELPPTPLVAGSVQRAPSVSAAILVALACGIGDPIAYRAEKSGALVHDVVPVPGQEQVQGNVGSVLLTFHSENAFHVHRPDFVLLMCLRADHGGQAGLRAACTRLALPLLSSASRAALASEEFVTAAPPSFGPEMAASRHAVVSGAPDDPDLRVDLAATRPLTARASQALAELGEIFERTARLVLLQPGDLALIDNRVTAHGRAAFRPRYDGGDRWIQRTFVSADLRASRSVRSHDGYVAQ
jgi:L-asparagine oxygenase